MSESAMSPPVICPYCNTPAALRDGMAVYPHRPDLKHKHFWVCNDCDAWVGCHPGTNRPLGRLANGALRRAKMAAHAAFDPLWKSGAMRRKQAYTWLAGKLGIAVENCHIGMFDEADCQRVIAACDLEVPNA